MFQIMQKNARNLPEIWRRPFLFSSFGDRLKNFFEDLFSFLENTCACVLGPWPRTFQTLASRGSVLGRAVLGLGFFRFLGLGLEPCVLDSTFGIDARQFYRTGQLVERLRVRLRSRRSEVQISDPSNRTQCCQQFATAVTLL